MDDDIGMTLRKYRLSRDIGLKRLSKETGLTKKQILDIELSRINTGIFTIKKYCDYFDIKLKVDLPPR